MISIPTPGISRRQALRIGGLAFGGLTLGGLLRAEAAGGRASHKSVIMIVLPGGPAHQDTFDLKPDAPVEIRGDFRPIATNVPGFSICDHLPRLATMADRFTAVRSLVGAVHQHLADQCVSGWPMAVDGRRQEGRPALGSVASKALGAVDPSVPPFVGMAPPGGIGGNVGEPGFLGPAHASVRPDGPMMPTMVLNGVGADRFGDRRTLMRAFDGLRRDVDASGALAGADAADRRAFDVLTGRKLVDALDLSKEDPRVVARYGRGDPPADPAYAPYYMDQFLQARRLVEAGVRVVTVAFGLWDTHAYNFSGRQGHGMKYSLPRLDQGVSALIEDLHARGLNEDVAVCVWGEFGRTPRINKDGGRDHWPSVACALLAGGRFGGGPFGATNRLGEVVTDRPVHYQQVLAALYRHLGIDPETTRFPDHQGRPQYLLEHAERIEGLG